jgi:hypothetical protein
MLTIRLRKLRNDSRLTYALSRLCYDMLLEYGVAARTANEAGVGTLASLFLTGKSPALIDEVYTFCEDVGLPIT